VQRLRVAAVAVGLERHTLLTDEDAAAQLERLVDLRRVSCDPDLRHCV
jgi:hypothetical protein